jgi:hypothetical protein
MDNAGYIAKRSPVKDRNSAMAMSKKMLISNATKQMRRANGDAPLPWPRLHPCNSIDPREAVRPENFNRICVHSFASSQP